MNFYCLYCSNRCNKLGIDTEWWYCNPCSVRYLGEPTYEKYTGETNIYDGFAQIEFPRFIRNEKYILSLEVAANRTRIYRMKDISDPFGFTPFFQEETILKVHPVLNGVTPDNAKNKIKTLLMFS